AGPYLDGQVLVSHDMLGISTEFNPRFLRRYAELNTVISDAVRHYIRDVKAKDFPTIQESY
ncbi:MAG: 3-methyl-2-oxobutanoate hydroxymethyltransferase, partial [Phormidesmis sp. FL-bin-119]|nr:3-methyl-2-oxobutanoate hydroxymethyltransferase [Pedobacter sp.]